MNRRAWLPIFLIALGLSSLIGCLYIPTFEHQIDPKQHDFRAVIGDAYSKKPIRAHAIDRRGIVALLGDPPLVSTDNSAIGYLLTTQYGYWLYPLCFTGLPDHTTTYVVRFQFDKNDFLDSYDTARADSGEEPFFALFGARVPGLMPLVPHLDPPEPALNWRFHKSSAIDFNLDAPPTTQPLRRYPVGFPADQAIPQ